MTKEETKNAQVYENFIYSSVLHWHQKTSFELSLVNKDCQKRWSNAGRVCYTDMEEAKLSKEDVRITYRSLEDS